MQTSTPGPSCYEPFDDDLVSNKYIAFILPLHIHPFVADDETIDLTEPLSVLNNNEETVEGKNYIIL